jgi:hypothetical protein
MTPLSRIALVIEGALIICSNNVSAGTYFKANGVHGEYTTLSGPAGPAGPAGPVLPLLQLINPIIMIIAATDRLLRFFILNYLIYE